VVEDDEPILMLAHTEAVSSPNFVQTQAAMEWQWPIITSSVPKRRVELVEEEVYVMLEEVGEGDPKRWIFNIGASNHMTGVKEVFTDLDTGVIDTV
jgi:hypothetical protein